MRPFLSTSLLLPMLVGVLVGMLVALPTGIFARDEKAALEPALDARIEALYREIEPKVVDAPKIGAAAALASLKSANPPIFVDVRSAAERNVSVIAGAVDARAVPALHLKYPNRPIIVYCTIGYRSGLATLSLQSQNIPARNLAGGILAWIAAGGGLVDAQLKASHQVHVYAKAWAAVPSNFQAIY